MSYRVEKYLSLQNLDSNYYLKDKTFDEKRDIFLEILYGKLHGLCFSTYEEGQKPGDIITASQINNRLIKLSPFTEWVRSFSCTNGNENIPVEAKALGIKTLAGAWLSKEKERNEEEISALIQLAKKGYVDIAAIGNEVLYRKELEEDELIEYLIRFKKEIPNIPVGYVDAYYEFVDRPKITEHCDIILANCYPFWESCPFERSHGYLKEMYNKVHEAAKGKRVIISETGWPSAGEAMNGAIPSKANAMEYFINTYLWAMDEGVECFYFSSHDESWKKDTEGDVGAYWGIFDSNGILKY